MIQQYKEAIEKSNIVSKTDINGIITFVNDEFCKISGYTRAELLGKNHNIVRDPSVPSSNFKLLWDTIKNKQTYKSTVKNRKKDGTVFYVNTTVIPILDKNGDIEEFIAIRYDVTKEVILKKELEKKELELKQLNKDLEKKVQKQTSQLRELNKTLELRVQEEVGKNEEKQKIMFWQSRLASLGQMLANVAHQWRQPLTQLNLNIYNMKQSSQKDEKDEVIHFYNESKNVIQNMSSTIDDFTNFFKPDKQKKYFDVTQSIKESLGILEQVIVKEQITITLDCDNITLLGIPNELSQVIINIIQNSKDAFNDNKIIEKKILIKSKMIKQFASIEIQDNAGGVKNEILDKVFEPYFTTKHSSSGTGLGLFMSKMICEQDFNGTINLINHDDGILTTIKIPLEG